MRSLKAALCLLLFLSYPSILSADFGNRFIADQRLGTSLDSADKKISYRFTCQDDMTLTAVAVFCLEAAQSPAYLVSLQADKGGEPSGIALASSTYVPHAESWATIPLNSVPLLKGVVYHLVLEQDAFRGGEHTVGKIGPSNFASFLSTDVLNHMHPNDQSPDPAANTLFFDHGAWRVLDREPVYAVYGTGSNFQGNPYDDPGGRPIYGGGDKSRQVLQGEVLHFHCGYPVKALVFRVRKQGHPTTPLNYSILSHNYRAHVTKTLATEVAMDSDAASSTFAWVTVGVSSQLPSFPAECYYFVFQTDSGRPSSNPPGCEDCYLLSDVGNSGGLAHAADMTFDGGAHLSRATSSLDGGNPAHWLDDFERDANVFAVGPVCPPQVPKEFTPLPTPIPLEMEKRFGP